MKNSTNTYARESLRPDSLLHKDQWLKVEEVCAITKMSKPHLYRSSLGALRINIGRSSFWSELAVQRWMAEQQVAK
jgi:predicted DNA-binding transcriptional regulator AlpA